MVRVITVLVKRMNAPSRFCSGLWFYIRTSEIFICTREMLWKIPGNHCSWHLNTHFSSSPLCPVCSPWDQSGWRCERGRCRCSRSRQQGELHRPSRASQARPTNGARTRVASAGAAAVVVPGRSSLQLRSHSLWPSMADIIAHRPAQPERLRLSSRFKLLCYVGCVFLPVCCCILVEYHLCCKSWSVFFLHALISCHFQEWRPGRQESKGFLWR